MSSVNVLTHDDRLPSQKNDVKTLTLVIVADGSDGGVDDTVIDASLYGIENWFLYSVETIPGPTNPTADYDITIKDADNLDIANAQLNNRSADTPQLVNIGAGDFGYPIVRGDLTVTVGGNSVNSAKITMILKFVKR